jgi:PEP-CTERM motif-containing protein
MKSLTKIPILCICAATMLFAVPVHADSVNLSTQPGSSVDLYSFPSTSNYAQYFGTGIGLIQINTYNENGLNTFAAGVGTTVGNITQFANTSSDISGFNGTFSNAAFNSATDVLTAAFSGSEFNGTTWVPFNGQLTETLNLNGPTFYDQDGFSFNLQSGTVSSATMSTVPEPGSLVMFGTGLLSMAGVIRRKLVWR